VCGLGVLESSCSIRGKGVRLELSCGMRRDENWKVDNSSEYVMLLSIEVLCRVIILTAEVCVRMNVPQTRRVTAKASPSEAHIRSLSILPGREMPVQHPDP